MISMKTLFRTATAIAVLILVWYLAADRNTPFTSNARVKAIVTPVVPKVSGTVIEVPIANASFVGAGELLARIDPRPFEISLARAEAELESATQEVGASSADVERAQAQLVRTQTELENTQLQSSRVLELEKKGLIATARADDARTALSDAEAAVDVARAELERARQNLGSDGEENPRIKAALANLAAAQLDLAYTELRAPTEGGVADLTISEGASAQAGQPLMTFVDARNVWVEAYLKENNLGNLSIGDTAKVVLDTHPGRVPCWTSREHYRSSLFGKPNSGWDCPAHHPTRVG